MLVMHSHVDRVIAALARKQHGAWSRGQATAVGATESLIDRRLRSGAWIRLDTSVYGSPAAPPTWHRSVMAAILAESWAVASHRSAAVIHGLVGFRAGRPEITIPPGAHARGKLSIAHRGVDVRHTRVDGIPCADLVQVFVDLSQVASEARVRTALARRIDDSASLLGLVRDRYVDLAPRGGRDLRPLRRVLDAFGAGEGCDESVLEAAMRQLFTGPGLPPIRWQAPFPGRETGSQRVDGAIEAWKVILEGDGRAWHTRVDDFDRDRRRDQAAAVAGYLTLRFSYQQIVHEPEATLRTLHSVGIQRTAA